MDKAFAIIGVKTGGWSHNNMKQGPKTWKKVAKKQKDHENFISKQKVKMFLAAPYAKPSAFNHYC